MNLVPAIIEMEKTMDSLKYEYDTKLTELQNGLDALRKINTVCETCKGDGKILRSRVCAEDSRPDSNDPTDWRECDMCHGSGKTILKGVD